MRTLATEKIIGKAPERILMFGEGNFLRAFIGSIVEKMNASGKYFGSVVALQGTEKGTSEQINAQNGNYTVIERGYSQGKAVESAQIISAVSRCINPFIDYSEFLNTADNLQIDTIISNTTEFGICYEKGADKKCNFPAKLTDWLYRRYCAANGDSEKGVTVLPCELIDRNGDKLSECVKKCASEYGLSEEFSKWLDSSCNFCNTLVDRIVSGYPSEQATEICSRLGYNDALLDVCEPFLLWVIENKKKNAVIPPFSESGYNVIVTDDLEFYRERKVRILNGAHTASALAGLLAGFETVEQLVKDSLFLNYIESFLQREVILNIEGDMQSYAAEVLDRFRNPFLNHKLASIALNSVSKYKARVLVSVKDCIIKRQFSPKISAFALAALIAFYKKELDGIACEEKKYTERLRAIFAENAQPEATAKKVLADRVLWDEDLTELKPFADEVARSYARIAEVGVSEAMKEILL